MLYLTFSDQSRCHSEWQLFLKWRKTAVLGADPPFHESLFWALELANRSIPSALERFFGRVVHAEHRQFRSPLLWIEVMWPAALSQLNHTA